MSVDASSHNYTNMNSIFSQFVAAKNPVRPRKNTAEGGCGGNSAVFLQKIEASPAALLVKAMHHRKILFSLREEKSGARKKKRAKSIFLWCGECQRAAAGRLHSSGVSRKCVRISFRVWSHIVCCEFSSPATAGSAGRLYSICQDFLGSIATFCESKTRFEPILLRKSRPATGFSCKAIILAC